jgi:hypothetical protein
MSATVEETNEVASRPHPVTVTVNGRSVAFQQPRVRGMEIKQTAIAQGVPIHPDFVLFRVTHGPHLQQIGDNEVVELHKGETFRAVAPDDNS